jgi:lysozyme family protein
MSTDNFNQALQFTLGWEGGFSNHPNDSGGATNFGITQATYNRYRRNRKLPNQSVRLIRRHEATDIYHAYYWIEGGCDKLSPKWALFDALTTISREILGSSILLKIRRNQARRLEHRTK